MDLGNTKMLSENFSQFCDMTSLHGWNFFYYKKFHHTQTLFWALVIFCMGVMSGYFISIQVFGKIMILLNMKYKDIILSLTNNIIIFSDFFESTVVYNIDSPTVSLDHVFFPSIVICNMNNLRRSFIYSLMEDESIQNITKIDDLKILIDNVFLSGGKSDLLKEEEKLIERKLILKCLSLLNIYKISYSHFGL